MSDERGKLTDKDRGLCLFRVDAGAYYFHFDKTGAAPIDLILGAVCAAGKGYHHTEDWCEENACEAGSYADLIQAAAAEAADEHKGLVEVTEELSVALGCLLSVLELAWSAEDLLIPEVRSAREALAKAKALEARQSRQQGNPTGETK